MSLSTTINQLNNPNITGTSRTYANAPTSAVAADAAPSKETGFASALTQASNTIPSKALSAEVLAATVPSTTIQTSSYVFDPLGVVGTIPESNVFLQAIRQMMGKPADTTATPAPAPPPTSTPTPVTAAVLAPSTANSPTSFNALPTAVAAMPAPTATATATTTTSTDASTTDFMSSLEAQLNYQNLSSTSDTETTLMDALEEDESETQSV
jgi:hypothetical protein